MPGSPSTPSAGTTTAGAVTVLVRYFAGAAAAAGREEERLQVPAGSTVADALARVTAAGGPDLARVVAASSFLLQATAARPGDLLPDGAVLDVLPPFAGG